MSSRRPLALFLAAAALAILFAFHGGALAQTAPLADFNGDGCVDGKDLILLGLHHGCCAACTDPADLSTCADPLTSCVAPAGCPCENTDETCFDAAFDIGPLDAETSTVPAPDGKIDASDISVLLGEFGEGCS